MLPRPGDGLFNGIIIQPHLCTENWNHHDMVTDKFSDKEKLSPSVNCG